MGNNGSKTSKGPAYHYVAHGIRYLEHDDDKKLQKSKKKTDKPHNRDETDLALTKPQETSLLNRVYFPGCLEKQQCQALMVSSDWTESIAKAQGTTGHGIAAPPEWLCSAEQYPFENIVMSGGGSKGYAYIGALKALEDAGILNRVKRVAGSSAGAICGGLLAVGCTPQEIADVFLGDIKWLFQDQKCACCCCIPKIFGRYGVHPGKRFNKIYGQHLQRKVGNPDITFGELYEKYGRELCVVVTNLSKMCSEYCHPKTTPDLPIRRAVRMSMSFPMVYEAVKCEINGQTSLYTDGGTLDQYPVHCFDGSSLELNHNIASNDKFNEKTLGLYVVSESAIDYKIWHALFNKDIPYKPTYLPDTKLARQRLEEEFERRRRKNKTLTMKEFLNELRHQEHNHNAPMFHYETCDRSTVDIRSFKEYFVTTIETLLISQRRLHIKSDDSKRTIAVNCGYIGTNDYAVEPGDREFMIRQGYQQTERFLTDYLAKAHAARDTAAQPVSGVIVEESPSRELSPARTLCYSHPPPLGTSQNCDHEQAAAEVNARWSKTFADFDDLDFIDSGPSDSKDNISPMTIEHSKPPMKEEAASNHTEDLSPPAKYFSNSNLNQPMRDRDFAPEFNDPNSLEYPPSTGLYSPESDLLNLRMKDATCVNAEVHQCSHNNHADSIREPVHSIETDLRTSLSDCSQPVSTSDTIDSGIHIYQPDEALLEHTASPSDCNHDLKTSETVDSGLHMTQINQPLLVGESDIIRT